LVPVLTNFGGGTESSKLNSGVDVVVVDRGNVVEPTGLVVAVAGADDEASEAPHPARASIPATRMLVPRLPTPVTIGSRIRNEIIANFAT